MPPINQYTSNNNLSTKNYLSTTPKPIPQLINPMIIEEPETIDINSVNKFRFQDNIKINNDDNLYEFNPPTYAPDMIEGSYPSMNSVLGQDKSDMTNPRFDNEVNYDFKFEDVNNHNYNFEFNKDDFNFK